MLLSSVSLFSNAQQDTFSYETISICYSMNNLDTCDLLLQESSTVFTDLKKSTMVFIIAGDTVNYTLSKNWIIGGIGDRVSVFLMAFKDDKIYKVILNKDYMMIEKEDECVKFKYALCSG